MSELYIGLMTGTSVDSIDAALVNLHGNRFDVVCVAQSPINTQLKFKIQEAINTQSLSLDECTQIEDKITEHYAQAILSLVNDSNLSPSQIIAAGCHGQTIFHHPEKPYRTSIQLLNSHLLAELTQINIVSDFRRADIAAGGQGAPLAPIFHQAQFATSSSERVIVNIGGIANITMLSGNATHIHGGFDCGPGNTLLDHCMNEFYNKAYDENGAVAQSGNVQDGLLEKLLNDDYFKNKPPKSTGREYFNSQWLEQNNIDIKSTTIATQDIICTLTELTAKTICDAITNYAAQAKEVVICGGGVHNRYLMTRLTSLLAPKSIMTTNDLGIDPDYVEALGFAWLAKQAFEGCELDLTAVTGAARPLVYGQVTGIN